MLRQIITVGLLMSTMIGLIQCKLTEKQISKRNYQEVILIEDLVNLPDLLDTDKLPMYPNGIQGVHNHISKHLIYPPNALSKGIQGTVILMFFVEKDGTIKKIEILQGVDPELNAAAVRAIKRLKTWIPGYQNGKPVLVPYVFPVNFRL